MSSGLFDTVMVIWLSKEQHWCNQIQRVNVTCLTPKAFFEQYQSPGVPVIITGLLKDECDWTLDYLSQKLGSQRFLFRNYGQNRSEQDKRQWKNIGSGADLQSIPFDEYAEMLRTGQASRDNIYLGKAPIQNAALENISALKVIGERLGLVRPATKLRMYMGPVGHTAALHYDFMDGLLMQMHGAKKLVLFPPSQTSNLYPFPLHIHFKYGLKLRSWYSQVNLEKIDLKTFPRFQEASKYQHEVVVHSGETLYIPAGWWHEVKTLGEEMSCSLNQFWRVYPTSRALISWNRWRVVIGNLYASPTNLATLIEVLFSRDRNSKLKQVLYRF
jgi:hypothetical protein